METFFEEQIHLFYHILLQALKSSPFEEQIYTMVLITSDSFTSAVATVFAYCLSFV